MKLFASILLLSISTLCSRSYGQCECLTPSVPEDTLYTFNISENPAFCEVSGYLDQNGFTIQYGTDDIGFNEVFNIPGGFFCDPVNHSQSIFINGELSQEQTNAEYPLAFFAQLGNTYEFRWTYESPLGVDNAGCNTISQSVFLEAMDTIPPTMHVDPEDCWVQFSVDDPFWNGELPHFPSNYATDNCGIASTTFFEPDWEEICPYIGALTPVPVNIQLTDHSGNTTIASCNIEFNELYLILEVCNPTYYLGDFSQDGVINTADLSFLLAWYGCVSNPPGFYCEPDLNMDYFVNTADLAVFLSNFGMQF